MQFSLNRPYRRARAYSPALSLRTLMPQKHSRPIPGGRAVWLTERLWALAHGLPEEMVAIDAVPEFDQDAWFGPQVPPTCRAVAAHARRIYEADLTYPIILSADGLLMDGGHRLAKAWLAGETQVRAVRFAIDPQPDYILPAEGVVGAAAQRGVEANETWS